MSNSCSIQLHTCAPGHLNFIRKLLTLQGRYALCVRVGVNMVPVVYKLWVLGLGSNPTVTSTTDFFLDFFQHFFLLLGTSVWAPFGPQSGPHPPSAEPPLGHHGTWSHEKEASAKMVQYDFVWVATHLPMYMVAQLVFD